MSRCSKLRGQNCGLVDHLVGEGEQRPRWAIFGCEGATSSDSWAARWSGHLLKALLPGPVRGAIFPIKSNRVFAVLARSRDLARARSRVLPAPPGRNS